MKKYYLIAFAVLLSCNKKDKPESIVSKSNTEDSIQLLANQVTDSVIKSMDIAEDFKGSFSNKKLLENSPVEVLSAEFIKKQYSNYKDVKITYKNISDKKIEGIKFEWYGENTFGEPADMGASNGKGSGFTDNPLSPGKTDYGVWNILSSDGKKIIGARAYEVVYSDGTKWNLY
ncbi:hypothetical protein [Chryseobacterium culicis]|uniref:hypothetical protein n=1 Tax=Chryseobacterium culicis TaxID=680127 RepID=UPI001873E8DB|nr:hypothetical protein [Chryseobacterium culicis]MBE4949956.1 hypothetical protein [Chryseobacterium culicis]